MPIIHALILALNTLFLVLLTGFGAHRLWLLYLFFKHGKERPEIRERFAELPRVTIQLPMYNEMNVVERLIDTICQIDYPRDRLQIQVLDDSTDESAGIACAKVSEKAAEGHDIVYLHRTDRSGYKAGALHEGLKSATGDFVAIFDADFLPRPDYLQKAIHHFTDSNVALVQFRWEHANRDFNMLTKLQSVFLDGHFVIESTARNRSGRFVNFNGTAGIWRRAAIDDAGGWSADTLTEDLELSIRVQMKGWRFIYLPEETAPSEVPIDVNAFKTQQHRWSKGMTQTMVKMLPTIWRARSLPLKVRLELTFQLVAPLIHPTVAGLMLLTLPVLIVRVHNPHLTSLFYLDLFSFAMVTGSLIAFYVAAEHYVDGNWQRPLKYVPLLSSLGVGISLNQTRACLEGLAGHVSPFERTPKWGVGRRAVSVGAAKYKGIVGVFPYLELALAVYFTVVLFAAIHYRLWISVPFQVIFMSGLYYTGLQSLIHQRAARGAAPRAEEAPVATPVGASMSRG